MIKRLLTASFLLGAFALALGPSRAAGTWFPYPGVVGSPAAPAFPISHIIVIMQENRTLDNMFNGFPGANTVTSGTASDGTVVALQPSPNGIQNSCDMGHSYANFQLAANASGGRATMFQGGRTGFDLETISDGNCTALGGSTRGAFTYVPQSYVQPLWDAVTSDGQLNDNTFSSNDGPSAPSHLYEGAATARMSSGSNLSVSDNDVPGNTNFGCINKGTTNFIDMTVAYPAPIATIAPSCVDDPTITDEIEAKHLTWGMAATSVHPAGTVAYWLWPANISHMCLPLVPAGNACNGPAFLNNRVSSSSNPAPFLTIAIQNCTLTQNVYYYIPSTGASDHPNTTTNGGPDAVTNMINAVGAATCTNGSVNWTNTAVIVLWDDWGGFFDHVVPPIPAFNATSPYEYGFRVPLMVVSAYSKSPGTVDHTQGDSMGCLNAFIEKTFGLPNPMGPTSIDQYCTNDWWTTMLNPLRTPITFVPITQN